MAINERLIDTEVAAAGNGGGAEAEQGLILHLDANDVDSYDGDGAEWVDISTFEKTIPLSDNADSLELYLNASDSTSYGGSGTTWTDISGNSNDGTISGATFDTDNGGYFDFDGVNDKVDFTGRPVPATSDVTIETWVKFEAGGNNYQYVAMIGQGTGTAGSILSISKFYNTNTFYSYVGNQTIDTGISLSNSTWYHLVVTQSGTSLKQYIDGELVNTAAVTSNNFADNFRLGYFYDTAAVAEANSLKGQIGQARVYSSVLSASDIGQNYRHGRDTVYTDLIPDTDLELHLDADSFPEKNEIGYSNTPPTWTDSSGNSNNGTITGATFDSELGNWLDFERDNNSHTVTIADSSSLDITTNITLEAWINPESNTSYGRLFWKSGAYALYLGTNGWTFLLGSAATLTHSNIPSTGTWYHIASTYDGSNQKMYINGELVGTKALTGVIPTNNNSLYIGGSVDSARFFDGKIGQARIYSSALTQDQIRQNYNFTKPSYPNGFDGAFVGLTSSDWNPDGYFFTNSGKYLNLGSDTALNFTTNKTISVWVNPAGSSGNRGIIGRFNNVSPYGWILKQASGNASFSFYDSSGNGSATSTATIPINTWTHLSVTYDGSNLIFYKNGSVVSTTATTAIPGSPSANTLIGRFYSNVNVVTYDFIGKISKVKMYDRALSASEITALYNEGE